MIQMTAHLGLYAGAISAGRSSRRAACGRARGRILGALVVGALLSGSPTPAGAATVSEIIDSTGDGSGNVLAKPFGIAVDEVGNVYVAGNSSDNLFKITPGGVITEVIDSTGDGGGNQLTRAWDVEVDSDGNAYVTGSLSYNVLQVTPGGAVSEVFSGFVIDLAIDAAGNLYVSEPIHDVVRKVAPGGAVTVIVDGSGAGPGAPLDFPNDAAVDSAGNVYVAGLLSNNVLKITPGGTISEIIDGRGDGGSPLRRPRAVAADAAGNVYVVGEGSNNAFRIAPDGSVTLIIDENGDQQGAVLESPRSIAVDTDGIVYVTGFLSRNVFAIRPGERITEILDMTGDGAGNSFSLPERFSIAVGPGGKVYVTGSSTDNAFEIEPVCGDGELDANEECDDGNLDAGDCCSPTCTLEVTCPSCEVCDPGSGGCVEAPRTGCAVPVAPLKAKLVLKDVSPDAGDLLVWKWVKGEQTLSHLIGDPLAADSYGLCLYAASDLVLRAEAPAAGVCGARPCWKAAKTRGFIYKDREGTPDGLVKIVIRSGDDGKSKVVAKGKGELLPDVDLPLSLPVTMQMQSTNGRCWEATYFAPGVIRSDDGQFKGRAGSPSGAFIDRFTKSGG